MPEKSKRRKNNKNKKKNKGNREDTSHRDDNAKQIENEQLKEQIVSEKPETSKSTTNYSNIEESVLVANTVNIQEHNQDLNNNTNNVSDPHNQVSESTNEDITSSNISAIINSLSTQDSSSYVVEVPEQNNKNKSKLGNTVKSKSLDNDDAPKITEITEDNNTLHGEELCSNPIIDYSNVIYDIEKDIEWENTETLNTHKLLSKEVAKEILSIPLDFAQCEQTKTLSPEDEKSLRSYLRTLELSTTPENVKSLEIKTEVEQCVNQEVRHRLRKKASTDDLFLQRLGPPRHLDVIDEEVSGESSTTSRRHSYLSDKKSDVEDLEDDVFENKNIMKDKFSAKVVRPTNIISIERPVQQQCILVGAKLKEPEISEARGNWTMKTVEKMTGAEVVYLTDSSSSNSSLHEIEEDTDDGIETDVSIRMLTPTIEVTDTENLLKKTFVSSNNNSDPNSSKVTKHIIKDKSEIGNVSDTKQSPHEIIVLSTDDIKTSLYVKDLNESADSNIKENVIKKENIGSDALDNERATKMSDKKFDLEIKVIKCELNDAINNLIKEVASDSETMSDDSRDINENNKKDNFHRQDSSSSLSSSQCTAKYNPTHESLNDVSNVQLDETSENILTAPSKTGTSPIKSHVKDVIDCISDPTENRINSCITDIKEPLPLKDFCLTKIASFPYGDKILEELASVSARIQNINIHSLTSFKNNETEKSEDKSYYRLPDSSNEKAPLLLKTREVIPPPIKPRNSSLKKSQDEERRTTSTSTIEHNYICLSPSQKMLMEKTNTVLSNDDVNVIEKSDKTNDYNNYEIYSEKYKKNSHLPKISSVTPLKSENGSRLLALICDPSITSNVHSIRNRYNKSIDKLSKDETTTEKTLLKKFETMNTNSDSSKTLKPKKNYNSYYESDESSDFTESSLRSMKNKKKVFHFSTGTLNKEIENDISSIQNMHRFHTNIRDQNDDIPRRPSLPKDLCDQQMEYIRRKEKEVDAEIKRLEEMRNNFCTKIQRKGPRAPLITEKDIIHEQINDANNYYISRKKDVTMRTHGLDRDNSDRFIKSSIHNSQEEIQREKMYTEYITEMAEREERKQKKVIKLTNPLTASMTISKSMSSLDILDSKVNNRIEKEFISRAKERWEKLGIRDPETEDERESGKNMYKEPKVIEHRIKVIEDGKEQDVQRLPSHLQEFVHFTAKDQEEDIGNTETVMITPTFRARSTSPAVWRPGAPTPPPVPAPSATRSPGAPPPPPPPPIWIPGSAGPSPQASRKTFRPVHFEETPPTRRKFGSSDHNGCTSGSESEGRLRTSQSAPITGLSTLSCPSLSSRLPRAPNPTVTLLQKAREGQIPRGTSYLQSDRDSARLPRDRPSPPKGDPVHALRKEYASESEADRNDYERGGIRKMADAQKKVDGIGPTTKEGIPITLRSEVKDPSRWYKKMYDTIHKNKYDDDYVTIRYKNRRGQPERVSSNKSQYAYFDPRSGYLSEPEGGLHRLGSSTWSDAYDSDIATGPRRRTASVQEDRRSDITSSYLPSNKYSTLASARASQEIYKNQPGRIEDYVPGRSSVIDKEAKQQNISSTSLPQASPKEKKDITSAILSKSNMAKALKESGYESDSTLIFRRREDTEAPLSPAERRAAYRDLQAGGEPPLRGFRSPAPPRQETNSVPEPPRRALHGSYTDTESPRRYVESDVNIHYRCPVRHDPLPLVPERELALQQAEHMKRLYREQRRNKYLQELQDMQNRRHQDNFTPSQKTVVPLNRYDEADKVIAKALYTFNGQTQRELSFRKGEIIHVRRQIDANWYEGEVHGKVGLFPYNYVEIQKGDTIKGPKKSTVIEGRARAKFDFIAQTNLELPLKKGEVVVLTRRIDQNWWEGRNGVKTGIFPDSYVTVLQEPSQSKPEPKPILSTDKPVASPAAHGLLNGTDKRSMGSHSYMPQPNSPALANAPPATQPLPGYVAKPAQATLTPSDRGYGPPTGPGVDLNNAEPLYVDTNAEAVPYRAMYKYRPQNPDELELQEGDTVYVLEKCDDGWYVGSSQRTGRFGTFPGNYVERI